jgi:hypothetical protein
MFKGSGFKGSKAPGVQGLGLLVACFCHLSSGLGILTSEPLNVEPLNRENYCLKPVIVICKLPRYESNGQNTIESMEIQIKGGNAI